MKITILCEGRTETAFKPHLREFLGTRLAGRMPELDFLPSHGAIPTEAKLKRTVTRLLDTGRNRSDAVIGLADVYPDFKDAEQAKTLMRQWVGKERRFHPHVAMHDFEAWLLPYWDRIQKLVGRNRKPFGANPEQIDHGNPPAHRLKQLFEAGKRRDSYSKPRDAGRILKDADLMVSIEACPELKAFVNTILGLCDPAQVIA